MHSVIVMTVAGELIGVEYLYSQTGQVLRMTVPEPDDAVEEEELVDKMELDEGFDEVVADVSDPTVSGVDDGSLPIPSIQAAEPPSSTAEESSSTQDTKTAVSQVTCRLSIHVLKSLLFNAHNRPILDSTFKNKTTLQLIIFDSSEWNFVLCVQCHLLLFVVNVS